MSTSATSTTSPPYNYNNITSPRQDSWQGKPWTIGASISPRDRSLQSSIISPYIYATVNRRHLLVSDDQITPSHAWRTTELLYPMELVGRSQFVLLSRLIWSAAGWETIFKGAQQRLDGYRKSFIEDVATIRSHRSHHDIHNISFQRNRRRSRYLFDW